MNRKLILLIIVCILVLAGVGGLLFLAVQKQRAKETVVVAPQIKKVLDERVISPVASLDNSAIWYFNSENRLFRVMADGGGLTEFPLPTLSGKITEVMWPKTGSDFIAVSYAVGGEQKNYYDSAKKIYLNLPANIQSMDWLPDSERVVYIWKSSDNATQQLVMANADGTGFQKIKDVFWSDLTVKTGSDNNNVLLYRQGSSETVNKIYSAKLDTGEISTVIDSGKNTSAVWIPGSNRFVFSQNSITSFPKLYLYDFTTKIATDLNISTNIDKIAFDSSGKFMFAATPKKDNKGDSFVKIDLGTFKQESILEPEQTVWARNLFVLGNTLYFVNNSDGKLYTITQ
jgi:hypothetical protein